MTENQTPETVAFDIDSLPVEKKKFEIKPIVKKVLIWGGVAAGVIVGAILLNRTNELEADTDQLFEGQDAILDALDEAEIIQITEVPSED